ncbi:hypothetical protein KJ765_00105 [Candidatus Micrarchaeota archaeon]|nr:hypothetical protein [Candidatus Micrarchaeota archaeon]
MRAQIGAEYIFLVALVFVLVSASVLQSFKDSEINLGLSGARLACQEFAAKHSEFDCYILGYSVDETLRQVNITPQLSFDYTVNDRQALKDLMLYRWSQIFRPDSDPDYAINCYRAAYFDYCYTYN